MGEQPYRVGDTGQRDLQRDGDLLFHLFGRTAGVQRNDVDLGVRHIGEGLHRQVLKGQRAGTHEQGQGQPNEQRLAQ